MGWADGLRWILDQAVTAMNMRYHRSAMFLYDVFTSPIVMKSFSRTVVVPKPTFSNIVSRAGFNTKCHDNCVNDVPARQNRVSGLKISPYLTMQLPITLIA